jgi:hypothetical protein
LNQVRLLTFPYSKDEKDGAHNPGLPPLHGSDGVHGVGFVIYVRGHGAPALLPAKGEDIMRPHTMKFKLKKTFCSERIFCNAGQGPVAGKEVTRWISVSGRYSRPALPG